MQPNSNRYISAEKIRVLIKKIKSENYDSQETLHELNDLINESSATLQNNEVYPDEHLLRLSAAFEQSANSIMITDVKGVIEYVNPRFYQVTGYSPDEIIGKNPRVIKYENSVIDYTELWKTIVSGKTWTGEFLNRSKSGELFWELATISPIRNAQGKIINYLAIKEDITLRKKTEKQLQEAKEFYLNMLVDFPVMVWQCDNNGVFRFFNNTFLHFVGEPVSRDVIVDYDALVHPHDKDKFKDALAKSLSDKSPFILEYRIKDRFGNYRWVLNQAKAFYNHDDNYGGLLATCIDIHERFLAELRLLDSEEKYRRMFEKSSLGIFRLDKKFRFVSGNKAFAEILGYDDLPTFLMEIKKEPAKFFPDFNTEKGFVKQIVRSKETRFLLEKELLNRYGEKIFVVIHLRKINESKDESFYLEGFIEDITQRKSAEKQLRQARDDAEKARMAQSEFLSLMSHEIRTPLNTVVSLTDLMLDDKLSDDQKENLSTVKFSAHHLLQLIDDILDFNKIEAGNLVFEKTEFDIRSLIGGLIKTLKIKAEDKNLKLLVHIDDELPEIMKADTLRLRQILLNMLSNAIKFTNEGYVSLRIENRPGRKKDEKNIHFKVKDTGIGIHADRLNAIFEKFTQAETSTSRKYGGSGLGLTICKRLVELQGGEIFAKSKPGEGSLFSFYLPMETGEKKFPSPSTPKEKTTHKNLRGLKILLVEDDKMNQFVGKKVIEKKWQADLTIAETGEEALEYIRTTAYDLILMDLLLPGISGYEVTQKIRQGDAGNINSPSVPVIAFTADAFAETRQKAYEAGVDDFVSKPFDYFKLFDKIMQYKK
ncbi:MAG: PAS domain S-box protein [Bacteroidales bacterium]